MVFWVLGTVEIVIMLVRGLEKGLVGMKERIFVQPVRIAEKNKVLVMVNLIIIFGIKVGIFFIVILGLTFNLGMILMVWNGNLVVFLVVD